MTRRALGAVPIVDFGTEHALPKFALVVFVTFVAACAEAPPTRPASVQAVAAPAPQTSDAVSCPAKIAHRAVLHDVAPPSGFLVAPKPTPGSETLACANLSRNEWSVAAAPGAVRIAPRNVASEDDPLPVAFARPPHVEGPRRVLAVDGGYLVGYRGGKGASLWFVASSGGAPRELAKGAVAGFSMLRGSPVAFVERTDTALREAAAFHVSLAHGEWIAARWIDLGGGVEAVLRESPESTLILSTTGLDRLTACGDMTRLGSTDYDVLYPSSLALDGDGVVYVGMRHFVTRWVPIDGGAYREEWLTKTGCSLLSTQKFECLCRG